MARTMIVSCVLLVAVPSPAMADVCQDVRYLIDQSASNFARLKGKRDPDIDDWYEAKFSLSNAECIVSDDRDGSVGYMCDWKYDDTATGRSTYDYLVASVSACLPNIAGEEKTPRQATLSSSLLNGRIYRLHSDAKYKLVLSVDYVRRRSGGRYNYEVSFSVDRDNW